MHGLTPTSGHTAAHLLWSVLTAAALAALVTYYYLSSWVSLPLL